MVRPFEWGLEHLEGGANQSDPARFFARILVRCACEEQGMVRTGAGYGLSTGQRGRADVHQPYPVALSREQHGVRASFRGDKKAPAVLLLPNWNAKWNGQSGLCEWLSAARHYRAEDEHAVSRPAHGRGHERADQLVGPNVGLTLQANRQAVQDAKLCLRWLEHEGFTKIGILWNKHWIFDWVHHDDA